jgi:hypothetical protein
MGVCKTVLIVIRIIIFACSITQFLISRWVAVSRKSILLNTAASLWDLNFEDLLFLDHSLEKILAPYYVAGSYYHCSERNGLLQMHWVGIDHDDY